MKLLVALIFLCGFFDQDSSEIQNHKSQILIKNPWIRVAASEANTAFFFDVENKSDKPDTLFEAQSIIAEVVEIHETYKKENDMMGMRKINHVVIPPKSTVKFKPRDLHVMLIKLKSDLKVGSKGEVTLFFKSAGKINVSAPVQDMPKMN